MILNRAQISDAFGIALGTVDAHVKAGMPGRRRGRQWEFDSWEVHNWLAARAHAKATKPKSESEEIATRLAQTKLALRRLDIEERLRVLIHIDDEAMVFSERQQVVRDCLGKLPDLIADALAAEPDAATCRAIMRQGVHQVLDDVYREFGGRP